jgi:hypothetical protein
MILPCMWTCPPPHSLESRGYTCLFLDMKLPPLSREIHLICRESFLGNAAITRSVEGMDPFFKNLREQAYNIYIYPTPLF